MSIDAEDVMKRVPCEACGECCEDYAPGVSSVTVDGLTYHPDCAPAHASELSAAYAKTVHDRLTIGANATRPVAEHPLLNEAEAAEMIENFLLNVPAEVFAAKLEARDIEMFEASIDKEMVSSVTS